MSDLGDLAFLQLPSMKRSTAAAQASANTALTSRGPVLVNPTGIRRARMAYENCLLSPMYIACGGHSIVDGVGVNNKTSVTNRPDSDAYGWPGQARTRFAKRFGVPEGGFLRAQNGSGTNETRVIANGTSNTANTGIQNLTTSLNNAAQATFTGSISVVASFTGSIAGTTLTLGSNATGTVTPGLPLAGANVAVGTVLGPLLSGTAGQAGATYSVNISQTVASTAITAGAVLTLGSNATASIAVGSPLSGSSVAAGSVLGPLLSGTAGQTGATYSVNISQTVASTTITAGKSLRFILPTCTTVELLVYQATSGTPSTGAFQYQVDDSGTWVQIANSNAGFTKIIISSLSQGPHTVTITGTASASAYFIGAIYHSGAGVVVCNWGQSGWDMLDLFGVGHTQTMSAAGQALALKMLQQLGSGLGFHLATIMYDFNDYTLQGTVASGGTLNPTSFQSYAGQAIQAISSGGCDTLFFNAHLAPGGDSAGSSGFFERDFYAAAKAAVLANPANAAYLNMADFMVSGPDADALSFYFDKPGTTVHPSRKGYSRMAGVFDWALTNNAVIGLPA